ncbi:MAG TPA: imidazolonepropionase [Acidobacteria bacterium]|jgi:imidazolonepropionase|nr:imidazolonepropionase [Acidobacteriota bacterium]MDP6373382.1 imidazolonepropionase [Vicinamibacterales bacterium]HAK56586.1 imidazolonepropionase [Acidobacteriota bacterium]
MPRWDELWLDTHLATMAPGGTAYGAITDGALAVQGERIAWVGRRADLPDAPDQLASRVTALAGAWLTPGLVDCHTHLVFGGHRAAEFQRRLQGESYESIARQGGGILSTVDATRAASEDQLTTTATARLATLHAEGVTTVEIKSGYGLDLDTELKMLRAARRVADRFPGTVRTTFLGAHAIPREYQGSADDYVESVCRQMLPAVIEAGLAEAVDVFCERIAFTPAQTATVFEAARAAALAVKLHADQLSDSNGAALAARYGALSADHLEYASVEGIQAMAEAGTTAVLLPAASYFTHADRFPPIARFRSAGVPMALATDCNPGSAPATSLVLMLNLACTLFRMTPEEALAGVTRHAARALGLSDRGTLEIGQRADLAVWAIDEPAELSYWIGANPCIGVICGGQRVLTRPASDGATDRPGPV